MMRDYTLDEIDQLSKVHEPEPRKRLLHADELDHLPPQTWLKEEELPSNAFVAIFGITEGGKSFVALDEYALPQAQERNVIYIAAEGASGYAARKNAWMQHHKQGSGNLYFWPYSVNLLDPKDVQEFIAAIAHLEKPLVIIDTQARPEIEDFEYLAKGCDLLIVPTTPDRLALDALVDTVQALRGVAASRYRILITKVPPKPNRSGELARDILKEHGLPVIDEMISYLMAFQKAADEGVLVYDVKDPNAQRGWDEYRTAIEEALQ